MRVRCAIVVLLSLAGASAAGSWSQPGSQPGSQPESRAEELERARQRLARGDTVAARPILDRLFSAEIEAPAEERAAVARTLLDVAVLQGDDAAAFDAWLVLAAAGEPSLVPAVAPFFVNPARARAAGQRLGGVPSSPEVDAFRTLATLQGGADAADAPPISPALAGGLLLEAARALDPEPSTRREARENLEIRLASDGFENAPPELRPWARLALGLSLLREPERSSRVLGMTRLVGVEAHAQALDSQTPASLRVLALVAALTAAEADALDAAASAIRVELETRFHGYPGLAARLR